MKRYQLIERAKAQIFEEDPEELKKYGFDNAQVQFYAAETIDKWLPRISVQGGELSKSYEDESLVIIDDTWLKLSMVMWTRDRKLGRTARQADFAEGKAGEWVSKAMPQCRKRSQVIERAGEIVCMFANLSSEPIMYCRKDDMPSLLDLLDPVQILIPAPALSNVNKSKVVESLADDKQKTVAILAEILEGSLDKMKQFEDAILGVGLKDDFVQPIQLLLMEDILYKEYQIDFEDFKQTVMKHELLKDQLIVNQIKDGLQQVQEYFQDKLTD